MASSLLALIDDIATLLDDVALLTKVAAAKTMGVVGDDLALNAQQLIGISAQRELPVVWAVAKGSLMNKAILVPLALVISAIAPWAVTPLLMVGGAYLCFEGMEKLAHKLLHEAREDEQHARQLAEASANPQVDLRALERDRIRGAVRTDFILSAEIIVIALGAVASASFAVRLGVLVGIAIAMTVGVYGLVAAIVKLDDLGLYLSRRGAKATRGAGHAILWAAPWLLKLLSALGTVAMFLVGGSIVARDIEPLHAWLRETAAGAGGGAGVALLLLETLVGVVIGTLLVAGHALARRLRDKRPAQA